MRCGATETPNTRTANLMLNTVVQEAINQQINHELFASYSYLAMAAWCEHKHFVGCGHWLRLQSQEEYAHAMKLYDFLQMRNCRVVLKSIAEPEIDFESLLEIFEKSLAQEQRVSEQIDALYALALEQKAFAALVELEWFVTEQVEEEKTVREVIHKLNLIRDDPASLIDLDREMGERSASADDA